MYLDESEEHAALRRELRDYFRELLPDSVRRELREQEHGSTAYRRIVRQLGRDGWLGIGWPTEYGGRGLSALEQFIFFDEVQRADVPYPMVTVNTVGPALIARGSQEQKDRYLSGILAGEVHFAIGYSEAEAGSDLASLKTRANKVDGGWVINGQKLWTSGAMTADYIWLAARTDPDLPKHKGISIFVVPTSSDGFKATPIRTLADSSTTATYYDELFVPDEALVGEVNEGWRLITLQLNHERVALAAGGGRALQLVDDVVDWARQTTDPDGRRIIDRPWVQQNLGQIIAKLEAMHLLNWHAAWAITNERLDRAESSAVKIYGVEVMIEAYRRLLEILGEQGTLRTGSPGALLQGAVERVYRQAVVRTFGGGNNEVQRELVAAGLGMPRASH